MLIKAIIYNILIVLVFALCFTCTACTTVSGLHGEDAAVIEANSRNIGRIEGTVQSLDNTIESSYERLGIVARASQRIKDAGERLDYLFTEYEQEVQRLISELNHLRNELKAREADKVDRLDSSNSRSTYNNTDSDFIN